MGTRLGARAAALALFGALALAGPAAAGGRAPTAGAPAAGGGGAAVSVNGYDLPTDVAPVLRRGRTLVPVRAVAEALGAEVAWNAETRTVTLSRNGRSVSLTIDEPIARIDGAEVELDVPGTLIQGRTMVPLRFVGRALGAEVAWDAGTRTARVTLVEKRDGLTPEEVLLRNAEASRAVNSYRYEGIQRTETLLALRGTATAAAPERAATTVRVTGAVRIPELYQRLEIDSGTPLTRPPALEVYADPSSVWMRTGDGPWELQAKDAMTEMAFLQRMRALDASAGLDQMRQMGIVPLFEADQVMEGRRVYVIRFLVDRRKFLAGYGGLLDAAAGGVAGGEVPAALQRMLDDLVAGMRMRAYIDAETFLARRVEMGTAAVAATEAGRIEFRMDYAFDYTGYGEPVEMPRMPEATPEPRPMLPAGRAS